jgi:hypothetical protein
MRLYEGVLNEAQRLYRRIFILTKKNKGFIVK